MITATLVLAAALQPGGIIAWIVIGLVAGALADWVIPGKGFGFIQRENGEDVFVHFSAISASGYRSLDEGARVSFVVKKGPKGLQAEDVSLA